MGWRELYLRRQQEGRCLKCGAADRPQDRRWCRACLDADKKRRTDALARGMCAYCDTSPRREGRTQCQACYDRYKRHDRVRRERRKDEAFQAYGGYVCACCGERERTFLQIDHVNNNGAEHRKQMGYTDGHGRIFRWLRKENYPPGFQVLCANCNWGKHMNGGTCPHQQRVCEPFTFIA